MWPVSKCEKPHVTKEDLGLQWISVWKVPLSSFLWWLADSESWWNVFINLPQSVQVREEVWGNLIWLHSYHRVLIVIPYILTILRLKIGRPAVALCVAGHYRESIWAPKGREEGTPKEQGREQNYTWTKQLTLSSLMNEGFQKKSRKDPRPLYQ